MKKDITDVVQWTLEAKNLQSLQEKVAKEFPNESKKYYRDPFLDNSKIHTPIFIDDTEGRSFWYKVYHHMKVALFTWAVIVGLITFIAAIASLIIHL